MDILHLDLSRPNPPLSTAGPALLVFWWGDRPVGQAWLQRPLDAETIEALAEAHVDPEVLAFAQAPEPPRPDAPRPRTTVVICTRDRPEALANCLASLPQQSLAPDQVVVVDNASADDRTRQAALAAAVEYVREDRPGLDIARNTGARAAGGDIVAYTDDDVRLHPRWLERLVDAFDDPSIWAVTGLVLPGELETEAQQLFERHWSFGRGFRRIDFGPDFFASDRRWGCPAWEVGAGASMAFRREVFERAGLFDERLDVGAAGCSGDSEYWHNILAHGGVCRYEPYAVAFHYHRRTLDGLASQVFAYMRGHAAALLVQYEQTRNLGNLRRALVTMPFWYARRAARRLIKGSHESDRFFGEEVRGFASGLLFYVRTPRALGRSTGR